MSFRPLAVAVLAVVGCGDNIHFGHGALLVSPRDDLHTSEAGTTATFTVALGTQPEDKLDIAITSMNPSEGTVTPSSITFTPDNYDVPRTITVRGVDDKRADGSTPYAVRVNAGRIGMVDVNVVNDDDDVASFMVMPQSALVTTESGGQASFTLQLTSQPSSDVTIPIASSNPGEGVTDVTSLTFTANTWDTPQTVTVTGVDDNVADGNVAYAAALGAATSDDAGYAGMDPDDVPLVNMDNDNQGAIMVTPLAIQTSESGTTAQFSVVLQSQPTADVTIDVASNDATEASASTAQLTFTALDWSTPHFVTVTGVDDMIIDGDQPYTIVLSPAVSADAAYSGLDPADVAGVNHDNDSASIVVTPTMLQTSESGTSAAFTVVLTAQPTGNVSIAVASSDLTEGIVSTSALVFDTTSWNQPQTVIVTGQDDLVRDGDITYPVVLSPAVSSDPNYSGLDPTDVSVTNLDNDLQGFIVTPTSLTVNEFGDIDTFTIVLTSRPTANVTVSMTSSDTTEGTVTPAGVTFTPANWNVPQTVTVRGVNDNLADGNIVFTIITGAAISGDPLYAGLDPPDVTVTNVDNDTPEVIVRTAPILVTSENGTTATFRIGLTLPPSSNVTCTLFSNDLTEGAVSPVQIIFTPGNFGLRTVTILGLDDIIKDGDIPYQIITNACTSADPNYNGQDPRDVRALNLDND